MLEVFKIVLLCLICTLLISLISTLLFRTILFVILLSLFYDFDKNTPLERHAINKIRNGYLKVRNVYKVIYGGFKLIQPTNMNNINKQSNEFDLSRFNRSGSVYSPISKVGNGSTSVSRRLQPHTSTPLTRITPWQKTGSTPIKVTSLQNNSLVRSPRYSLSSSCSNTKNSCDSQSPTIQTAAGPLLASTRFNINLGTYTDSKSPGLAGRIVQYHNETQGSLTHQSKYGSPGQFPIVQLYKKELPLLSRSPRRCTVRIAPPDTMYNSPEANAILRETFSQTNRETLNKVDTEINTKSVLDALKEISRKRIHTNDDISDINKRQRTGSIVPNANTNGTDSTNKDGKRLQEESPNTKGNVNNTAASNVEKRVCVTDEIECSMSSSLLLRLQGQKRKAALESLLETNKQRKVTSKEGKQKSVKVQANMDARQERKERKEKKEKKDKSGKVKSKLKSASIQTEEEPPQIESTDPVSKPVDPPEKARSPFSVDKSYKKRTGALFDSKKLDIMRKNRLAMAIATLTGEKPKLIPVPKLTIEQMKEEFLKEKEELEKEEALEKAQDEIFEEMLRENERRKREEHEQRMQREKPVVIPEVKLQSILSPKNKAKHDKHVTFSIPGEPPTEPEKTPTTSTTNNQTIANILPNIESPEKLPFPMPKQVSFGAITNTTVSNNTISTPAVNNTMQPSTSINFGSSQNTINFSVSENNTGPQPSGFNTEAVSYNTSQPTVSFGTSQPINFGGSTPQTITFGAQIHEPKPQENKPFSFESTQPASPPKIGGFKFDLNKPTSVANEAPKPTFNFGSTSTTSFGTSTPANNTPITTTTSLEGNKPEGFGGFTPSNQNNNAFGSTTTQNNNSFGGTTQNNTFGNTTTQAPGFGTPTTQFGTTQGGQNNMFAASGTTTNTTPANTTQNTTFGTPNNTFNTNLNQLITNPGGTFGGSGIASNFGGTTTKSNTFGGSTTQSVAFGGTSTSGFGATTQANAFGTNTTQSSAFGSGTAQGGAFGTNTTQGGAFGTSTTQGATFGTSNTQGSTFGTNTTQGFGSNTTQGGAFGTSTTQGGAFGAGTTQSSGFGTGTTQGAAFGTATTQSNTFGTATTQNNTFGTSTTQNNAFGNATTQSNAFGTPTTQSNAFGTPTTQNNAFGTNQNQNTFGATTTQSSTFGTTTNTFGTATTQNNNAFGGPSTQTNAFGTPSTQNNTFGTPGSAFTAPATQSNVFGTQTPAFGTPTTQSSGFGQSFPTTTQSTTFGNPTTTQSSTFGSFTSPTTSQNVFGGFGTVPKTTATSAPFSFGSNTGNKPFSFNATTTATVFGGTNTNSFGGFTAPTTTAAPSGSGMFGQNTTSSNVFGGSNPTTTTASIFGTNTTTTASSFGQPSTGIFGSSSSGFGTPAAGFGANQTPGFGTAATPAFGATFQPGTTPNQGSVFGGTTQPPNFGSTNFTPPGSQSFGGFGTTTQTNFGTTNTTTNVFGASNQSSSGFTGFGATTNQTAQPPGIFAFGSSTQPSAGTPSNAFQFGATNTPKPGGFNFTASNPPAFGASPAPGFNATPNTGMFNIGSGSTGPKQRPIIKARRRNN